MLINLRLWDNKGLRECELLSLGKINVLCGKNNSGKSTILETIKDSEKCAFGINLTEENYEITYSSSCEGMGWGSHDEYSNLTYKRMLKGIYHDNLNRMWFSDEAEQFVELVRNEYDRTELRSYAFNHVKIREAYNSFFLKHPNTILLPPKRTLDLAKQIDTSEPIKSQGTGVLNFLFFTKNQAPSSQDRSIYEKIDSAFNEISSGYKFDIFPDKENNLFLKFAYENQPWIGAADCGLGLQDLLIILFFSVYPNYELILIEEPESHIHPDMQRKLVYYLRKETDKQYFITTHSNVFLDNSLVDKVFFVRFDESIAVDDATSRASILGDIGYSVTDNLVSDLIILIEGPTDRPVVEEFLIKMGLYNNYNIKLWPLGGDIMDKLDLSVFSEGYKIIALVDKDPKSGAIRKRFTDNCEKYGISMHKLKRYAIENYFTLEALRAVFGTQIPDTLDKIDPNVKLEKQIGLDPKNNNRKIAQKMTVEDIKDTDFYDFLLKVQKICEED